MSRLFVFGSLCAAACTLAVPVYAADAIEEIIVTASRVPQPGYSVGGSYSVITGEQLAQRQTVFIGDALRALPGIAMNQSGQAGAFTQARLRGTEANMALVVVDGVKVNPTDGTGFDFGSLLALDIDRIEVLRGAQSSIWGSAAIGGVINIISKDAAPGFGGQASFEGGSLGTKNYQGRLSYGSDVISAVLGGSFFHTNGISQADEKFGASEHDGNENGSLNGRIRIKPMENLIVTLQGRYINTKLKTDSSPPFDSNDYMHLNQRWGNATVDWTGLDGHIQNVASVTGFDLKSGQVSDFGDFSNRGDSLVMNDQFNLRGETNFLVPAKHRLTFFFEFERDTNLTTPFTPDPTAQLHVAENRGYVGEYATELFDQLFLTASVRRDDANRFNDSWTYRGTAAFRIPSTHTKFHGSYGTGILNPSLFQLFGSTSKFTGNPDLKPQSARSIDFGVEQSFFDNRFKLDATAFEEQLDNRIEGSAFSVHNVEGRSTSIGLEVTATAAITTELTVDASYTAMDTQDPSGAELIRRPRSSGSANLNYAFAQRKANVNVGMSYQGRSRDTDFCAPDFGSGFCSFPFPGITVDLRGHTLINLAASYDVTPNVQLHARIENALDQQYEEVVWYGEPRISAFGGVTVKFGE